MHSVVQLLAGEHSCATAFSRLLRGLSFVMGWQDSGVRVHIKMCR